MTQEGHPDPLVPSEADLRDFEFMPLDVRRLRDSDLASSESPEVCWAAVLLWSASWHQVPAASLPNDDKVLANLAGYSRFVKEWLKVKSGALRGFVECSDGRLYHRTVAEKAIEAWLEKLAQRLSSGSGNAKRWQIEFDPDPITAQMQHARTMLARLNPHSRSLSKKRTLGIPAGQKNSPVGTKDSPDGMDKESRPDPNRQGQGQGFNSEPSGSDGGAVKSPAEMTKAELWAAGKSLLETAGLAKAQCGSFVGKLVKDYGDSVVVDAVRAAVVTQPADPVEYLKATCQRSVGQRSAQSNRQSPGQKTAEAAARWLESQGVQP